MDGWCCKEVYIYNLYRFPHITLNCYHSVKAMLYTHSIGN